MAKITRKKLSRGVKLTPEHVYPPLTSAAAQLSGVAIEKEQTQRPMAPFCVNLTMPYLTCDSLPAGTWTVPFVLPPTQDFFATATTAAGGKAPQFPADAPRVKLKSVSFSFDQRAEAAAICSQFWELAGSSATGFGTYGYSAEQGMLTYEDVLKLDIRLSLHEKTQSYFGDTYPYNLQGELWSMVIPASEAYSGVSLRANPFFQSDLDIAINPYKTLLFTVHCPGLKDTANRNLCLPSIEASFKFASELMPRDTGQNDVQNIPADGGSGAGKYGAKTGPTVTISAPVAGNPVESDSSTGVNANITTLDEQFQDKLEGGYNRFGDVPPREVLVDDAAYDVIAVPLFQNTAHGGLVCNYTYLSTQPYIGTIGALNVNNKTLDRRVVPLHHSYTVHHAVLAWNWSPWNLLDWDGSGTPPIDSSVATSTPGSAQRALEVVASDNLRLEVGIGIGTGLHADGFGYDEIASLSISNPNNYDSTAKTPTGPSTTGATWDTGLIDRITSTLNPPRVKVWNSGGTAAVGQSKWNWELHSIPVDGYDASDPGAGYYNQGEPVFMGPGWTKTQSRSNLDSATPSTTGAEQWLEVRAQLRPHTSGFLDDLTYQFDGTKKTGEFPSILVGYGGCYVYLICKKHLTK